MNQTRRRQDVRRSRASVSGIDRNGKRRGQRRITSRDRLGFFTKLAFLFGGLAALAIVVVTFANTAQQNMRGPGGIELIGSKPNVKVYGPPAPESESYSFERGNITTAEVLTPSPTMEPETAFVNRSGFYFHKESCEYVTEFSEAHSVPYLLNQGYKPCDKCNSIDLMMMEDEE